MNMPKNKNLGAVAFILTFLVVTFSTFAQETATHPWSDKSLSPDVRADLVLKEMTLDEKIDLIHGNGMPGWPEKKRDRSKTTPGLARQSFREKESPCLHS